MTDTLAEWELRQAFRHPGCPICTVIQNNTERFYRWFILETYGQLPMLETLSRGGFCPIHGWEVAVRAGQRISFTYEFVVQDRAARLRSALTSARAYAWWPVSVLRAAALGRRLTGWMARRRRERLARAIRLSLAPSQPCPVCDQVKGDERYAYRVLARLLEHDEERAAYQASAGLCWHHLTGALPVATPTVATFLAEDGLRRLEALGQDFREYFRKLDYRFASEPRGAEQRAWLQAARYLAPMGHLPACLSEALDPNSPLGPLLRERTRDLAAST
ncbi:DUF6062 family protein [Caldinitratiruptor microaerophilus]|uniref:Uncharacterized protein n=1 Tax=Caldinitratiruptor microaerophilus TaxID=671077 RepID=A0AA35CN70_9FIRM|nr:DUF6062 family protein [Caldinitratiruptor microaerophilus]BDG61569.1 hypothetical protein caldi_26590 [Caldinitratiruptor microaerophilus]